MRYRSARANSMLCGFAAWWLATLLCLPAGAADEESALTLIERGTIAMRANPDESEQDAERALEIILRHPDVDLEIRARLLLCDYYSERDVKAAQQQIDAADALLPRAQRKSLRAGVLTCRGETLQSAGDIEHAKAAFDEAIAVATAANDEPDADPFEVFWATQGAIDAPMPDPVLGAVIRTQWLDTGAAATMLGFTVGTMQTYRWMGTGPAFRKIGRRVVYSIEALNAWQQAHATPTNLVAQAA